MEFAGTGLYLTSVSTLSLAREGLILTGVLAAEVCAATFPGLAELVLAMGLEVLMYVIIECVRKRVALRVP